MKTTLTKIALLGIAGAIAFALCSFRTIPPEKPIPTVDDERAEWYKVRDFIKENISDKIAADDKKHGQKVKMEYYSRCPSGYNPSIAGKREEVKTSSEVFGKIVFYKGCSSQHICDFKVCVDKGEAFVKEKNSNDYMSVKEWIDTKHKTEIKSSVVKG